MELATLAAKRIEMAFNADPDDRYHEANHCLRKVRYLKRPAMDAAARMAEKEDALFDAYECVYCGGWHVGRSFQK